MGASTSYNLGLLQSVRGIHFFSHFQANYEYIVHAMGASTSSVMRANIAGHAFLFVSMKSLCALETN
jgi:hypothetical protein